MLKQLSSGFAIGKLFPANKTQADLSACGTFPIQAQSKKQNSVPTEIMYNDNESDELSPSSPEVNSLLITLYRRAHILTREEIPAINRAAHQEQSTCGRILLRRRRINACFHRHSIELLVAYKEGEISFEEAIDKCRNLYQAGRQAEETQHFIPQGKRLGELLLAANMISETQLFEALEKSLNENKRLGEVLIDSGLLVKEAVEVGLAILPRVSRGNLALLEAVYCLKETFAFLTQSKPKRELSQAGIN
jgi:hypothetical protein